MYVLLECVANRGCGFTWIFRLINVCKECILAGKKKKVTITIDSDVYDEARDIAKELGLTVSGSIEMFLRTMIRERGLPFDVNLKTQANPQDKYFSK